MNPAGTSKVLDRAIKDYHAKIAEYDEGKVHHETGRRHAFQTLLDSTAKPLAGWQFVAEEPITHKKKSIRPDGLLRDHLGYRRGFWEAKDKADDLEKEIRAKIAAGYPTENIIFEDTHTAILFQDGNRHSTAFDLKNPIDIRHLLDTFYQHTTKDIVDRDEALTQFKENIPELGTGLKVIIETARAERPTFRAAFNEFLTVCRDAINPTLRDDAVVEMVIQHLMTERIIRKVFNNPDFNHKNVIAHEIEKVIDALTSESFSRDEYLKRLDKFYGAIERTFANRDDFREKQDFLNTLYENFFQGFAVKAADTHGIVYTPQEIVDFMCASVAEVLKDEFGLELGGPGVTILDPCTGTGNFIVNLIHRIAPQHLEAAYRERLFANEVMLMPYYIAALNIEHAYAERMDKYESFEGLCFVDTLDLKEGVNRELKGLFSDANTARVQREYKATIRVLIGNPPYNVGQLNENDNNKNRVYRKTSRNGVAGVDDLVSQTYANWSKASSTSKLNDPYVKFFRWATDRLRGKPGVVCFVSNNSFLDKRAFDGMRKHLSRDFKKIYHLDLRGDVRENEELSGTAYNVFGIRVGVGITIAVSKEADGPNSIYFAQFPLNWKRARKLTELEKLVRSARLSGLRFDRLQMERGSNPPIQPPSRSAYPLHQKKKKLLRASPMALCSSYFL